jgi:hypothetical protein
MFSIEPVGSREANAVYSQSLKNGFLAEFRKEPKPNTIAVGSVDYCLQVLPKPREIINFYPSFLKDFLGRDITLRTKNEIKPGLFVKSATSFKKFEPFVVSDLTVLKDDVYWCSEVVNFVNEWRYYIANGKQITSGWYLGGDDDEVYIDSDGPKLNINWPDKFCGAVDFGLTDDGRLLLVESHPPFACGWYGVNNADYVEWLITSWKTNSWINL